MFEHYVYTGTKRLRCGYTTGSCAALAAKAATRMLLGGKLVTEESIQTPAGIAVHVDVIDVSISPHEVRCAVKKDGGDDEDATDGMLIYATVAYCDGSDVCALGGEGVGRVTKPGLDQPVGEAAINTVPRQMIKSEVENVREQFACSRGIEVTISAPQGKEIAEKTFNAHLGITGGISILGTSGIVKPRSVAALKDSIELEFKQQAALGIEDIVVSPGNYGKDYATKVLALECFPLISCSNFIGDALDYAARYGFHRVLLVGHVGKMVKLAGGIMDTHSKTADCRSELFCAHAALCGANAAVAQKLFDAATADACLATLKEHGLYEDVLRSIAHATQRHLERRAAGAFEVGAVVFSHTYGELYRTSGTRALMDKMEVK